MSADQLGWNRSYRQAVEKLVKIDADKSVIPYDAKKDIVFTASLSVLMFTASLFGISNYEEVMNDCASFRADNPHFPERYGK